jgi:glucose-1-phosphatase
MGRGLIYGRRMTAALIGRRDGRRAKAAIRRIIRNAAILPSRTLYGLGVAHTDFFQTGGEHKDDLLKFLQVGGTRAELLFMNPNSKEAKRRDELESIWNRPSQIDTITTIRQMIASMKKFMKKSRLENIVWKEYSEDASCFILFNDEEMILHPFLTSAPGKEMETMLLSRKHHMFIACRNHFENLWRRRWVLFDLGGVLVDFDHGQIGTWLAKCLKPTSTTTPADIRDFIFPKLNLQIDRGRIDIAELLRELRQEFLLKASVKKFKTIWSGIFGSVDAAGLALVRQLRDGGHKVGVASNTNEQHWKDPLEDRFFALFDECFLSFQIGACKPSDAFFRSIALSTARPLEMHYLVDDRLENVIAARAVGMPAYHFTPGADWKDVENHIMYWKDGPT